MTVRKKALMETNKNNWKRKRRRTEHDGRTAEPALKRSTRNTDKADLESSLIALLRSESWDLARSLLDSVTFQSLHIADWLDENGQTIYHKLDFEFVPGDLVSRLLTDPNFFSIDCNGNTPLHLSPSAEICAQHAINAQNYYGETPLHLAVLRGQRANVELLLQHGASMDIEDQLGNIPLNMLRPDITPNIPNIATNVERVVECNVISALSASSTVRHKRHENLFGQRPPIFRQKRDKFNNPRLIVPSVGRRDRLGNTGLHVAAGVYAYIDTNKETDRHHLSFNPALFFDSSVPQQGYADRNIFGRTPVHEIASHPCGLLRTLGCRNAKRAIRTVDGRGRNFWHLLFLGELTFLPEDLSKYMDGFSKEIKTRIEALSAADVRSWEFPSQCFRDGYDSRDYLGRTPLHYAAMSAKGPRDVLLNDVVVLYFFGLESLTARDIYDRTPLHYAYMYGFKMPAELRRIIPREFLDENLQDGDGFSPKEWYRRSESLHYIDKFDEDLIKLCRNLKDVSKTIAIDPYKVWIDHCQHGLCSGHYRATFALEISGAIRSFMERLVAAIGVEDRRLIGKVIEVGSAFEETKLDLNDEYDFTVQLTALSRLCEVSNTIDCPPGFCIVKKRDDVDLQSSRKYSSFADFFDDNKNLKTVEVQFWFQRALVKVLSWQEFWNSEPLLELCPGLPKNLAYNELVQDQFYYNLSRKLEHPRNHQILPNKLGKNVILRFNRPLNDTIVMHPISVDIVPAVCVEGWWPADAPQPADSKLQSDGCNLVFSQPFHKHRVPYSAVQYAQLSFARQESLLLRNGPEVVRAAYVVAKRILECFYAEYDADGNEEYRRIVKSHVIKTAALWAAAAKAKRKLIYSRDSTTFTKSSLQTLVESLFAKLTEFAKQDYVPSYFAPSLLRVPVWKFEKFVGYTKTILQKRANVETLVDDDGKRGLLRASKQASINELNLLLDAVSRNNRT